MKTPANPTVVSVINLKGGVGKTTVTALHSAGPPSAAPGKNKPDAVRVARALAITDAEKREILFALAEKYEAKEFMPHVNQVRDFLNDGERDVSRIKSRAQVTVAVFKRLGDLETGKLREMLERGLYGPPKRLAPYARAIEGFRRHNRPA